MKHYNLGAGHPACGAKRRPRGTVNKHADVTCERCKQFLLRDCGTCRAIKRADNASFSKQAPADGDNNGS